MTWFYRHSGRPGQVQRNEHDGSRGRLRVTERAPPDQLAGAPRKHEYHDVGDVPLRHASGQIRDAVSDYFPVAPATTFSGVAATFPEVSPVTMIW